MELPYSLIGFLRLFITSRCNRDVNALYLFLTVCIVPHSGRNCKCFCVYFFIFFRIYPHFCYFFACFFLRLTFGSIFDVFSYNKNEKTSAVCSANKTNATYQITPIQRSTRRIASPKLPASTARAYGVR